ncbi:MAG: HYR domain-containing protein, partial [Saprospiraceae bacterium]
GVGSGTTTISITSLGFGNNNNQFVNNNISRTQYGIYSQGASLASKNTGNVINQNLINTLSPNNVRIGGILVGFENNLQVNANNISGMGGPSQDIFGISLGMTNWTTTTFTGNEVTNSIISRNIIGTVNNTTTFSAAGIIIANALTGTNTVHTNMISGVFANGTSGDFSAGIFAGGGVASTTNIFYNTVSMSGVGTGGSAPNYALAIGGVQPIVDVRNNILSSTGNNGTGINIAIGLAYAGTTGNYQNLTSDYNDLYASGVGSGVGVTGSLAAGVGIVRTTLTDWRNETGRDLNSFSMPPVFVSTTDLHLTTSSGNQSIDGGGTPIAGITTDIDCQTRSATIPDIGADEFCAMPLITITETSGTTNNDGIVCSGATVTLTGIGEGTFAWSTGSSSNPIVVNPTTTTTYTLTVTDFSGCSGSTSVTITVVPLPVMTCPADMTVCADAAPFALTGALPPGGTYSGPGVSNGVFSPSVAGVGVHTITYSYTDPTTNCSNTCTFLITVAALPVTICPDDFSTCINDPIIVLSGGTPIGGVYSGPGVIGPFFIQEFAGIGTHTIVYSFTDGNGCSDTCNFLITVNPLPEVTCPDSFSVCLNDDPFSIPPGSPEGGMFSGPGVVQGTTFDPSMAGVGEHTITYTFTDQNGCTNSCTFTITVLDIPDVTITVSPNDTVCSPQTITLNAGPGYATYLWSNQATTQTTVVSVSGTYSVTVTDENGCSGNTSTTVVVNDPPEVTETHINPSDCFTNDGSIDLTVTGTEPFSYNWASNTGTGLMNGIQDQTGLSVGTYRVTVTNDITGCASILSIVLSVEGGCGGCDPVEFVSVMPDTICSGDSATFTAEGTLPGATFEWFDSITGGNSVGTGNPFV